jgi:hypothetical protein
MECSRATESSQSNVSYTIPEVSYKGPKIAHTRPKLSTGNLCHQHLDIICFDVPKPIKETEKNSENGRHNPLAFTVLVHWSTKT